MNGNRRRGLTLTELLVAAAMMAALSGAITYAFIAGLDLERAQRQRQTTTEATLSMERRIAAWLEGAYLSEAANDEATYFIAEAVEASGDLGADRLTFTSVASSVPLAVQASDDDFESQQEAFGVLGGVAEVALSTTPTGDAGESTGLFERIQRPADSDATQGGRESALETSIEAIGFQFYDGTAWVSAWDTQNGGERRLPQAVQVSYTRTGEPESVVHRFVVPLPASDVDAQNPATATTGATP